MQIDETLQQLRERLRPPLPNGILLGRIIIDAMLDAARAALEKEITQHGDPPLAFDGTDLAARIEGR